MIGPLEKGIAAADAALPPEGVYEGVDLTVLPKYISFRAALLHGKLTYQYVCLILSALLVVSYASSRIEINRLYTELRAKEYILAPGVQDFTPVSPMGVSDDYIADAVTDFINKLGNVNAGNIDEQYALLSKFMSPQLEIQFEAEAAEFKRQVKAENISELLSVADGQREITPSGDGFYHVVAIARRDRFIGAESVGHFNEAIEMELELTPLRRDRAWYVQIDRLKRMDADTFKKENAHFRK